MKHLKTILFVALLLGIWSVTSIPVHAHEWRDFYQSSGHPMRWPSSDVSWGEDRRYVNRGEGWWLRTMDATIAWNNVSNGPIFRFNQEIYEGARELSGNCLSNDSGQSGITVGGASGGWVYENGQYVTGSTQHCPIQYQSGEWPLNRFAIAMSPYFLDRGSNGNIYSYEWYTGTGDPSANQGDLWGALTHEFGHATGFNGHFSNTYESSICAYHLEYRETMCEYMVRNSRKERNPSNHDAETLQKAYSDNWSGHYSNETEDLPYQDGSGSGPHISCGTQSEYQLPGMSDFSIGGSFNSTSGKGALSLGPSVAC
jgi:hypothetical protein